MSKVLYFLVILIPFNAYSQKRIILDWEYFKYDKPLNAPHDAILSCGISYKYLTSLALMRIKLKFNLKLKAILTQLNHTLILR